LKVFKNLVELEQHIGIELGPTDWKEVSQAMIDDFAQATGDHQWIHVDQEKAAAESPFGTTIAHGFLTLSLLSSFSNDLYRVESSKIAINYGVNRVRFTAAVPSGSQVRMRGTISKCEPVAKGLKFFLDCAFELENSKRPACYAQAITLIYE
jgi:acyl dehydratase